VRDNEISLITFFLACNTRFNGAIRLIDNTSDSIDSDVRTIDDA